MSEESRRIDGLFARAFVAIPDGLAISRPPDGAILEANDSFLRIFGLGRGEVIGRRLTDLDLFAESGDQALALAPVDQGGHARAIELTIRPRAGGERRVLVSATLLERDGEPAVLTIVRDLTDRSRAEDAAREGESRLAAETAALAELNEACARLWSIRQLGEGLEEILRASIDLLGGDKGNVQLLDAGRRALFIAAQRGFERPFLDHFRAVSADDGSACGRAFRAGRRLVIEDVECDELFASHRPAARAAGFRAVQSTPLLARDGSLVGVLSTHFRAPHRPSEQQLRRLDLYARQAGDFIARCRTEEALRESEDRFRTLADAAPVLIWVSGPAKEGTYFNQRWLEFTGVPAEEQLGEGWIALVHPADRPSLADVCAEAFRVRRPFTTEFRLRRADGEYRWLLDTGTPRFDGDGQFLGFIGSCVDITERHEAEEALRLSQERCRALVEGQSEMVCRFRPGGEILFVNDAYARSRGVSAERLIGLDFWQFVPEEDRASVQAELARLTPEAPERRIENRFETAAGVRWTLWTNRALRFGETGRATELQSVGIDITDRKLIEELLRDREQQLRAMLDQAAVGIAVVGLDGRFLEVNQRLAEMLGYGREELLGAGAGVGAAEVTRPDELERTRAEVRRLVAAETDHSIREERLLRKDGSPVWARATVTVIRDSAGSAERLFAIIQDITEHRQTVDALHCAEAQLRLVADHAPVLIAYCDADRRYKFVNKGYAARFGLTPEQVIGRHISAVVGEAAYASFRKYVDEVLAGRAVEFELELPYEVGGSQFTHCAYAPERDGADAVVGFVAAIVNISERRNAELSLARRARQQAALYRLTDRLHRAGSLEEMDEAALDSILPALGCDRASILRFDAGGVMRFTGHRGLSEEYRRAVEGHSPWRPEDVSAEPIYVPDVERADLPEPLLAVIRGEGVRALGFIPLAAQGRLIGKFMVYFDAPHEFDAEEGELALAISRQLAFGIERHLAEHAVRRSEGLLRAVVEAAVDGIVTIDELGTIHAVNPAMQHIFGYAADELVGRDVRTLIPEPYGSDHEAYIHTCFGAGRTGIGHVRELQGRRRDGTVFPLDLAASETRLGDLRLLTAIIRDITQRKRAEEELRIHREQLERLVVARTAELEESHRRLRLSERMASLGTLSAGLGHDMGNILVPMRVWIDLLRRMDLPASADQHLRSLHQSTEYLKALASGLRSLSLDPEDAAAAPHRTLLAEWWRDAQGLYQASLPRGVRLHAPDLAGVPPVSIPPHALTQVVFNLVQNAGHMMRERGTGNVWINAAVAPGAVRLSVRD
ncbi:MAG TPA: PAS domain S-box protein, partial [Phycisphaerales bacterium]|nr:PAS domain S-box protein [Phycisphaerales bacterium]